MPKLLGEFLQEQQEPFALEVYLLERGFSKGTSLDASSSIRNSARFLKRSACGGLKKRRYAIPNCSGFVKSVFSRLVLHNSLQIKNPGNRGRKTTQANNRESREEHADEDKFSSASSTTVYNSCSESDAEDGSFEVEFNLVDHSLFQGLIDSRFDFHEANRLMQTESLNGDP